jgi:hypothetical protein
MGRIGSGSDLAPDRNTSRVGCVMWRRLRGNVLASSDSYICPAVRIAPDGEACAARCRRHSDIPRKACAGDVDLTPTRLQPMDDGRADALSALAML